MTESVCVIITNWNQAQHTIECLETVYRQEYRPFTPLVVDNGSTDDTVARVKETYPQTEILTLPENLGPTGGYNSGFRYALEQGFDFIFLLNNDTLLAPDCISELMKEAQSAADIGLVMPKIYYADEPKRIWSVGGWENQWNYEVQRPGENQLDEGQWEEAVDIDDAPFCAVLLTRNLLETVGLPDDNFFLYYEDRDFSRRAQEAGFRLRLAPKATMWHKVSVSSGGSGSPAERYWMARSGVQFYKKNVGMRSRWFIVIPWRGASALRTTFNLARQGRFDSIKAYWTGLWHGIRGIK
ncbi:MAG: glycosyltransferase family 2 protein [Chloroflexi bacterium]|nr:glycosyltransferase family 2 protein [Chloroflexota bacterium]